MYFISELIFRAKYRHSERRIFSMLSFRAWCLSGNVRFVFVKHPRMKSTQRAV